MLGSSVNQLARYFVIGVVGLLLTISFNFIQNNIEETGDRYYRIPLLGNEFKGKRARQTAMVILPLFGFMLMAVLQPQLVRIALHDLRVLSTLCGLLIAVVLISSSSDPEYWNVDDGRSLTHYAAFTSLLLTTGPWIGPWLIKIISRFLVQQYNRLSGFLISKVNELIGFVLNWIAIHKFEVVVILVFLLLGYVLIEKGKE